MGNPGRAAARRKRPFHDDARNGFAVDESGCHRSVDQDPAGREGDRVSAEGPIEVWARTLADGSKAVGIFNRHQLPLTAHVDLRSLGYAHGAKARDLWHGKDLGSIGPEYSVNVPAHGVVFLKVTAIAAAKRTGRRPNSQCQAKALARLLKGQGQRKWMRFAEIFMELLRAHPSPSRMLLSRGSGTVGRGAGGGGWGGGGGAG